MIDAITTIANLLKDNCKEIYQIKAFAFGSATHSNMEPNDIDILIIYDDPNLPPKIRKRLVDFGHLPIHLIFLTPQEEIETNFIKKQNCVSIL